jgi:hypothetical protein
VLSCILLERDCRKPKNGQAICDARPSASRGHDTYYGIRRFAEENCSGEGAAHDSLLIDPEESEELSGLRPEKLSRGLREPVRRLRAPFFQR